MFKNSKYLVCLSLSGLFMGCAVDATDADLASTDQGQTVTTDFELGLQLTDHGTDTAFAGDMQFTSSLESGGAESPWSCDNNCWQPDAARVEINGLTADEVKRRDFRMCMVGSDGKASHTTVGVWKCTPWASAGGGVTGMATDQNAHDPDSYKVKIETRAWPTNVADQAVDVRVRIRGYDIGDGVHVPGAGPWGSFTGWASQGGGLSGWGCDANCFDPDGFELDMDVLETTVSSFCSPGHQCQHGFGDCDTDADCITGTTCVQNVGNAHGYTDNTIDVCVD